MHEVNSCLRVRMVSRPPFKGPYKIQPSMNILQQFRMESST